MGDEPTGVEDFEPPLSGAHQQGKPQQRDQEGGNNAGRRRPPDADGMSDTQQVLGYHGPGIEDAQGQTAADGEGQGGIEITQPGGDANDCPDQSGQVEQGMDIQAMLFVDDGVPDHPQQVAQPEQHQGHEQHALGRQKIRHHIQQRDGENGQQEGIDSLSILIIIARFPGVIGDRQPQEQHRQGKKHTVVGAGQGLIGLEEKDAQPGR